MVTKKKVASPAVAIPADAIYQIKMLKPRIVNTIKTAVGDLIEVFAKDAARLVKQDKHAEFDPPLNVQAKEIMKAAIAAAN